jgi:hypothetical protein
MSNAGDARLRARAGDGAAAAADGVVIGKRKNRLRQKATVGLHLRVVFPNSLFI